MKNKLVEAIIVGVILGLLLVFFVAKEVVSAIDKNIENQDRMLCESAKVSGNTEYLKKCASYYETGDIKAIVMEDSTTIRVCHVENWKEQVARRNQGDERGIFYDKQTVTNILLKGEVPVIPLDSNENISSKPCA